MFMHVMTIALPAHCSRIGMSKGRQLEGESEKGQGKLHEFALGDTVREHSIRKD